MNEHLRILIILVGMVFTCLNIYLLLKKRVGEKNTLFWLAITLLCLIIAFFPQIVNRLSKFVGVDYPPSLLFLIAILVLLFFSLVQSVQIFKLQKKLEQVTRELSMVVFAEAREIGDDD